MIKKYNPNHQDCASIEMIVTKTGEFVRYADHCKEYNDAYVSGYQDALKDVEQKILQLARKYSNET